MSIGVDCVPLETHPPLCADPTPQDSPLWATFCGNAAGEWHGSAVAYNPMKAAAEPITLDAERRKVRRGKAGAQKAGRHALSGTVVHDLVGDRGWQSVWTCEHAQTISERNACGVLLVD